MFLFTMVPFLMHKDKCSIHNVSLFYSQRYMFYSQCFPFLFTKINVLFTMVPFSIHKDTCSIHNVSLFYSQRYMFYSQWFPFLFTKLHVRFTMVPFSIHKDTCSIYDGSLQKLYWNKNDEVVLVFLSENQ